MGRKSEANEVEARELVLYTENTSELWGEGSQGAAIRKNLVKKWRSGKYDRTLAPKAFEYLMDTAAAAYGREFPGARFTASTRRLAAEAMADQFDAELRGGEWDHYAPNCHTGMRRNGSLESIAEQVAEAEADVDARALRSFVDDLADLSREGGKEGQAAEDLRNFCVCRANAIDERRAGKISRASMYEDKAEAYYRALPKKYRW